MLPRLYEAAGSVALGKVTRQRIIVASAHFTVDLHEDDNGIWTASMIVRGERLEARSETPEDAKAALVVALRSELAH